MDRTTVPVGVVMELGAKVPLPTGVTNATVDTDCNNPTGLTDILNNPAVGLIDNNLRSILFYRGSPWFHEDKPSVAPGVLAVTETTNAKRKGKFFNGFEVMAQRLDLLVDPTATGLDSEFVDNGAVANSRTVADPLVSGIAATFKDHQSLKFYVLSDDTQKSTNATKAAKNNTLTQSFAAFDPSKPATAMWRDTGYGDLGSELQLVIAYAYPCFFGGVEGDFFRQTDEFINYGNGDLVDAIRARRALVPTGVSFYWLIQAHQSLSGAPATNLRIPTDKELRTQFFLALGEGANGLFFFPYTNYDIPGGSANQPMLAGRPSALAVANELSSRLRPEVRRVLAKCIPDGAATPFTAVGGGSTGYSKNYASATVQSLTHPDGTRPVVVTNRGNAAANVTVIGPSGVLVHTETKRKYRVNLDAIPLNALDGAVFYYDAVVGVPDYPIDFDKTVEEWWATSPYNPSATGYYIPASSIRYHTKQVNVPVGGNLQALVDAAAPKTTFVLPDGFKWYDLMLMEKSGHHFVSANPVAAKDNAFAPELSNVRCFGTTHAQQYNSAGTSYGFVYKLETGTDPSLTAGGGSSIRNVARRKFLRDYSKDILFDGIRFRANPAQPIIYYKKFNIGGLGLQTDHWYEGTAFSGRVCGRMLWQRCQFIEFVWGSDNNTNPANPPDPQQNNTGPVSHPGIISINAGAYQICVRDSDFVFKTNLLNTGSPSALFVDGAQGCVFQNNTVSGKQNQDTVNFLINDDYTGDWRMPGTIARMDQRQGRYIVINGNTLTTNGSPTIISASGENVLVSNNTLDVGTGTIPSACEFSTKICRHNTTRGLTYRSTKFYVRNNTFVCNTLTACIEWNAHNGHTPGLTKTDPLGSFVGEGVITGNTARRTNLAASTVVRWQVEDAASIADGCTAIGPHTINSNNVNDSTLVGI